MDIQSNNQNNYIEQYNEEFPQNQAQHEPQIQNSNQQLSLTTKQKLQKKQQMPIQFNKAKRTLTKMINQYFQVLKQQYLQAKGSGEIIYDFQQIYAVQSAISKLVTIRYTDLGSLMPKKSEIVQDFLLSYISQSKKIIKYNQNIAKDNAQKPKQIQLIPQQDQQLPDSATPAAFGAYAYFFDGSRFDFKRMVYVPIQANYKINLITGQLSKLPSQPSFYRIKCCIIKIKLGFFIIGGYAGPHKSITKQCIFYSIQNQKFHQIQSLNLLHNCPSGCIHNNRVYVFSSNGIEYFQQNQNRWIVIQTTPKRLRCLPFQYCISVSSNQIMIIGGKVCNQNSTDLKLFNTQTNKIDEYTDILPVGVCNQRSWGPMIINNFVTVMSNIQASIYPQVTVKRDTVQMVLIGHGGSFLNTLICSQ